MLIVATSIEIHLLAITFKNDNEIEIHTTKYSTTTDNVLINSITSTFNGRIFMGGSDGNLYELIYQSQDSLFSKKFYKVNHTLSKWNRLVPKFLSWGAKDPILKIAVDNERKYLYTVTESSIIERYYLGINGDKIEKVWTLDNIKEIAHSSSPMKFSEVDESALDIVSIKPVSISESERLHLICTTQSGIRLYLTEDQFYSHRLNLAHVRFPPEAYFSSAFSMNTSFYNQGIYFLSMTSGEENFLIINCPHSHLIQYQSLGLFETLTEFRVQHLFTNIEEKSLSKQETLDLSLLTAEYSGNELADQFILPPRCFLGLTSSGLQKFVKIRPLDTLIDLLIRSNGADTLELKSFLSEYRIEQTCAMLLHIICCDNITSSHRTTAKIQNWRREDLVHLAKLAYFKYGQRQIEPHPYPLYSQVENVSNYSGCHEGLVLYIARLLRVIWNKNIVEVVKNGPLYYSTLNYGQIHYLKGILSNLNTFLKTNPQFSESKKNLMNKRTQNPRQLDETRTKEQRSLGDIWDLIKRCLEILSLLEILSEAKPSEGLTDFVVNPRIENLTFSDAINFSDPSTIIDLIKWIILSHNEYNSKYTINDITNKLRDNCPSFFSEKDRIRALANETMHNAMISQTPSDRIRYLNESLKLYKEIAVNLVPNSLIDICSDYRRLRFYEGVVELCLTCADAIDKENFALTWMKSGSQTDNNSRGAYLYKARSDCYLEINKVLTELLKLEEEKFSEEYEIAQLKEYIIQMLMNCTDELCHYNFYKWYIENNLSSELINMKTPYIESFLKYDRDLQSLKYPLLWRYYLKNDRFGDAAEILVIMAHNKDGNIKLEDRIEYLTKAVNLAQAGSVDQMIVQQIKERVDVSRIQLRIKRDILKREDIPQSSYLIQELDNELFSVNTLYEKYCEPYGLYESTLVLIQYSEYSPSLADLALKMWIKIVQQEIDQLKDSISPLEVKVKYLVQQYTSSEHQFPLDQLILFLEVVSLSIKNLYMWREEWVAESFLAKIPFFMLFSVYYNIYESKREKQIDKLHLISIIVYILEKWKLKTEFTFDDDRYRSQHVAFAIDKLISDLSNYPDNVKYGLLKRLKELKM